jgi:hypothetical protein
MGTEGRAPAHPKERRALEAQEAVALHELEHLASGDMAGGVTRSAALCGAARRCSTRRRQARLELGGLQQLNQRR